MSEHKLVSPLLDGFQMGDPISSHDGVRCCPAIRENSDNKYIIKILSIPASQSQLDALLLTGAFQDAAGALNYFKELTDGVVQEIRLHQKLARTGGFVPCEAWQVVPMENNSLGYDVYLLTPYRRTLERHLKKGPMTHLEAVNLGLDLCAALTACRRAGHLYVDLKPNNVFISDDKNYQIGDLGFISLDSIQYAALPSKYRSCYSAPELHDVFATINSTADTYALGLVLYQVYNNGVLPFENQPPVEELAPPANADEEMTQIIMKACHPDPAQRWQDPTEMGQALVAYMQRNTINDVPIEPPVVEEEIPEEEPQQEELPAEEPVEEITEAAAEIQETAEETAEEAVEEAAEEAVEEVTEEAAAETASEEPAEDEEEAPAEALEEETPAEEPAAEIAAEVTAETETQEAPAEEVTEEVAEETTAEEETPAIEEAPAEEPVPEEAPAVETAVEEAPAPQDKETLTPEEVADEETQYARQLSDDIADILAQADELVAHEIPEPVVVPEIKLPDPPAPEAAPAAEEPIAVEEDEEDVETPLPIPEAPKKKKKGKKILITLVTFLLLAALGFGGKYYYDNYYLIPVTSITLEGAVDQITAQVVVDVDESRLTAVCSDTYGNTTTAPVQNGVAQFTGLKPGCRYTVSLDIEGFNQLSGNNSAIFTTESQTNIVNFSATTGAEDGSVILSFTVDGTDPSNWTVEYATEGQEAQTMDFTGHMVTVTGLEVDAAYTFRLYPTEETDVALVGTDTLEFTVSKVLLAQNIVLASFADGTMEIRWEAPAGMEDAQWTVRCTDGGNFDQTVTVTDCAAQFTGAEMGKTYTVEVLAEGMTQSARGEVTPKELTVSNVSCTPMGTSGLRITWEYEGDAPAEGWTVTYSVNGGKAQTITSDTNAADIKPVIPGASYEVSVAGITATHKTANAEKFADYGITTEHITGSLCITPKANKWNHEDVTAYTKEFSADDSISAVVYINTKVKFNSADVDVLYVVRDGNGNIIPELCHGQTMDWKTMWTNRYFYPTLPTTPAEAGSYTMELYFNGALALSKVFTIN